MKKLFISVITICLMFLSTQGYAEIKFYDLSLKPQIESGNTTAVNGGVSNMRIEGDRIRAGGILTLPTVIQDSGYCGLEITNILSSQAQQALGGVTDEMTFSIFYRTAFIDDSDHWAAAKRQRIFYDTKISGHTKYQKSFSVPPGSFAKFYWETSGATAFDIATAKLITGLPEHYFDPQKERVYLLYLGPADSGNTTEASSTGVSNMLVDGEKYKRSESTYVIDDTEKLVGDYFGFQVDTLTISQVQQEAGGDYSGVTLTFRYKETMIDETAHWEAAQYIDIITAMALSGNTLYEIELDLQALGFIRFYMATSGVTAWDFAKAKFIAR